MGDSGGDDIDRDGCGGTDAGGGSGTELGTAGGGDETELGGSGGNSVVKAPTALQALYVSGLVALTFQ